MSRMKVDGIKRALAFVTSAYSSYSSCRQYRENIDGSPRGRGAGARIVDKIRAFHNHPGFVDAATEHVRQALETISS